MTEYRKITILLAILLSNISNIYSNTFIDLYQKINNQQIVYSDFDSLIFQEVKYAILNGSYKNYLNSKYLSFEKKHWNSRKDNLDYEIKKRDELRKLSKFIEHDMYFLLTIEYCIYIENQYNKLITLSNLENYLKRYNLEKYKYLLYSEKASTYFKIKNYKKAILYWEKSLQHEEQYKCIQKSSTLNNIACAYEKKNQINMALKFNLKAQKELIKNRVLNKEEFSFYYVLKENEASYAKKLGFNEKSLSLFKEIYQAFLKEKKFQDELSVPANEILLMSNKNETINYFDINKIEAIFNNLKLENGKEREKSFFFIFLFNYYEKIGDYKNAYCYVKEYDKLVDSIIAKKFEKLNLTNKLLQKEKIQNELSKANFINFIERKKTNYIYFSVFLVLITIVTFLFLHHRNKSQSTNLKLKEKELELSQKALVEKELLLKKELASNLELSLSVKKKSEEVFLEKLKELKRKKNNDPDELLKELQLQIMNLSQIDKKQTSKNAVRSKKDTTFIANLRELHPELTEQELRLCSYFRMGLSGKEISQLEQQLAASSIKVIKNRIKRKLNLTAEVNLDGYLNGVG